MNHSPLPHPKKENNNTLCHKQNALVTIWQFFCSSFTCFALFWLLIALWLCHNHHHYHQCYYPLHHNLLNLHLMTSSPPSVTGFALLWLLSQDYSLVSHHPPSYFSAPTWQVASKSEATDTTRTMMEGTGRKTTDYIWVSLLPCSNFSHRGWFWLFNPFLPYLGNMTNCPDIQRKIGPILDLMKVPDRPSVLDRAQLEQDQRLGLPTSSFTNNHVLTTTRRGRTRPSAWVEPTRNPQSKKWGSGPQCVYFVFLYFVFCTSGTFYLSLHVKRGGLISNQDQ